jgi:hypothetical protein
MTSIDAVTITAQFSLYSRGGPDPDSPANLHTNPGSAYVGRWQAGILSLNLPAGGKSEVACRDVTEAIRAATLVWDTPAGQGAIEHRQTEREAEQQRYKAAVARAIWTGERRHEWQEPKQLVALAKAAIQQAVKDGVLPMPNDYRVTWRSDDEAIYVRTHHAWVRWSQIAETVKDLLRPFNASGAGDFDGHVVENWVFNTQVEEPTGPKKVRSLPLVDRMRLERTHRVAVMERAGFPAADIAKVQASFATYAPAAE